MNPKVFCWTWLMALFALAVSSCSRDGDRDRDEEAVAWDGSSADRKGDEDDSDDEESDRGSEDADDGEDGDVEGGGGDGEGGENGADSDDGTVGDTEETDGESGSQKDGDGESGGDDGEGGTSSRERVENPFAGAEFYISPEYAAKVEQSRKQAPEALKDKVKKVKSEPTAFWLDTIASVEGYEGRMGLADHLDEALKQADESARPVVVVMVVYDLPNRDCAAMASNGELQGDAGMKRYKNDYIGEIMATIESRPAYQKLRLVAVIEPDSLPNLVTNLDGSYPNCNEAEPYYREGVRYAVSELSSLDNVYLYLDIAHSGWLGWEHTQAAANLYRQILSDGGNLMDAIQGFATNVANYSTLEETFNPYDNQQEYQDLIENFYEWNRIIDEVTYVEELRKQFSNKGFIIDTSRNGWTPRGEGLPLDSRTHRGNWCNQKNAGLGERPKADPREGVHAYFWIKPPGESDGTSNPAEGEDPDNPTTQGKKFDPMCGTDPVQRPYSDEGIATGALAGAPHAGMWFHEQFLMLVENATPSL